VHAHLQTRDSAGQCVEHVLCWSNVSVQTHIVFIQCCIRQVHIMLVRCTMSKIVLIMSSRKDKYYVDQLFTIPVTVLKG
jgi:hypothetical protein